MPIGPQAPEPFRPALHGYFSQYGQLPTTATIAARQAWGHLPLDLSPWPVRLAVADCGRIGDTGWLWMDGHSPERFIVFDCAGHWHTVAWMEQANILGEVDYETALRWDIVGQGGIAGWVRYD